MLRIHTVCIELVREVRPLAERIEKYDRDQARQLRRSAASMVLNLAEGEGSRGARGGRATTVRWARRERR